MTSELDGVSSPFAAVKPSIVVPMSVGDSTSRPTASSGTNSSLPRKLGAACSPQTSSVSRKPAPIEARYSLSAWPSDSRYVRSFAI